VSTPDRMYLGNIFDSEDNPIILGENIKVYVEKIMPLPDGVRFISSSYIIDAQEI
jgi:hypothetical protein